MATSIVSSSKNTWGFSPQSIPGLAWWLDGADTTSMTFSSGSNISTWKDKSGKGCNATGFNSPQKISTGGVSFVASSSNYFTMNVTYSPTQTMFMVASPVPSTDANQYYINTNPGNRGGIFLGGYNSSFISYYNNTITNFASGTTTTPFVVSLAKVAGVTSVGTYNGSQAFSIAANTVDSATSSWTVLGGAASNANLLTASIYEFIIFNVALPTTQIQQVEGYLAAKWGLKANLPATHPYSATASVPFNRPFYPTDIGGCLLWLDAADASTVTGTSSVTAWADKSGNGYNASGGVSPSYSSNGVQFNGSSYLTTSAPAGNNSASYFIVFKPSSIGFTALLAGNALSTAALFVGSSTSFVLGDWITNIATFSTTITAGTTYLGSGMASGGVLSVAINGGTMATGSATFSGTGTFTIGAGFTDNRAKYSGAINEIIVFNSALSTSQRQQVEQYLGQKWGLVANLPPGHPGKLLPAFSTAFTPKSVAGLKLWLDGADTTTITGTSSVTAWNDKSGNGNNATATGSPTLAQNGINGRQAVTAAVGTCFLGSLAMSGPSLTCFAIATTNVTLPNIRSPRADQRLVSLAAATGEDTAAGSVIPLFNQDSTCNIATFNNTLGTVASNPIVTGVPFMAVTRYDGTTGSLWFNGNAGSLASSSSTSNFNTTKYGIGQQANAPRSEYWSGFIGEVILFNTSLTTSQRQQVEGYLAWKWGLQRSLPSTHAYAKFSP